MRVGSRSRLRTMGSLYALLALAGPALATPSPAPVRAEVEAEVSPDLRTVRGTVDLTLTPPGAAPLDHVDLWLFPERLGYEREDLDEITSPRVFPRGFDPAALVVHRVEDAVGALVTDRIERTLMRVRLREPAAAGTAVRLRVTFRTTVPHRYGPFGVTSDQLTLDGGWFPRPPPRDRTGFRAAGRSPEILDWSLRLTWAGDAPAVLAVNGQLRSVAPATPIALDGRADRVALVLVPGGEQERFQAPAGTVHLVRRRPRRRQLGLEDLGALDIHAEALATAAVGLRIACDALPEPDPRAVTVVEVPLRRRLATLAPGMVLLSDRAFEVTPLERFTKFHRVALLRAVLGVLLAPRVRAGPGWPTWQLADLAAEELVARWEKARYGNREGARDVLSSGSFVAAVDDILHAPQVPFPTTWFRVVDDTDRLRDRLVLFSHQQPSGRLLRERLRDRTSDAVVAATVDRILAGATLDTALAATAPDLPPGWLAQWSRGPPRLNYRLAGVEVVGPPDPRVRVTVARDGAPELDEPITILVVGGGRREKVTVAARGPITVVEVPGSFGDAPSVWLDPGYRLVESDLPGVLDARYDNANTHPWRFLLEGVFFNLNTAAGRINASVSGLLRRADDPRHLFVLGAYELERQLGASIGYIHGFGPKLRANRLRYGMGVGLAASWLKPFEDQPSGVAAALSASLFEFSYLSRTDPRRGMWLSLRAGPRMAWRPGDLELGGFVEARVSGLYEVAPGHVLAGRVKLNSLLGDTSDGTAIGVGGFGAVRAFGTFAGTGLHRALASLEWRHPLGVDLSIDLLHLVWIHRIDGALFLDAAILGTTAADMGSRHSLFVGAGYGLRIHYLVSGFHPMVLSADVGFPLVTAGQAGPVGVAPFSLAVGLGQPF